MPAKSSREINVLLKSSIAETGADGQPKIQCLGCEGPLENHQPDAELPGWILATCDQCKRWHLVNFEDGDEVASVIMLPHFPQLLGALRS